MMRLVSKKSDRSWLLNATGLAFLNLGRPKEAEKPLETAIDLYVEDNQFAYASVGYQNLSDLQFRTGELEKGLKSARKALEMAEKVKSNKWYICSSKAYIAWILHLLGEDKEAEEWFRQADELETKISGYRLCSLRGIFYADFLISIKRIDEASELTQVNLEICQRNNWLHDIPNCHRSLGTIKRINESYKEAETYLQKAFELVKKVGVPDLEIETLLESCRLYLDMKKYEDAINKANEVIKICDRTGFKLYESETELILAKANLAQGNKPQAKFFAQLALSKAKQMHHYFPGIDAEQLLNELKQNNCFA